MKQFKKISLLLLVLLFPYELLAQSFTLKVYVYQNSCNKQKVYSNGESQLTWSLSSERATLYYGSNYSPIEVYQIIKVEYNEGSYYYTFYDLRRAKYGIIAYFKTSNTLSMQYVNQSCSLDYGLY